MVFYESLSAEERSILDLVTFDDVLINYNKNFNIHVNFTLASQVKGSTLDWIGIFGAGWDKFESFLAFEWGIGEPVDTTGRKRKIIFHSQYLKRALANINYQFVYISKHLEILGVSQFFHFTDTLNENETLCLNDSAILSNGIHDSTEYNLKTGESSQLMKESMPQVKNTHPSCSLNIPNNFEQVYTTCWRCKSLFEVKSNHNSLVAKLKKCTEQNEELKYRLSKLETALENVWVPKTLLGPWDSGKERMLFQRFVKEMTSNTKTEDDFGTGDHWCDDVKDSLLSYDEVPSSSNDYFTNEITNNEVFLKAIIGNQEEKIRKLTSIIIQMQSLLHPLIPRSINSTDVVTLVKTEEKMVAEKVELTNVEVEKENNEIMDIVEKDTNDNGNLVSQDTEEIKKCDKL